MRAYLSTSGVGVRIGRQLYRRRESGISRDDAMRFILWDEDGPGPPRNWPLPNVWLGTSVENQRWADVRIPELLATPAAVRFLSCEPLLGPLDLRPWLTRVPTSGDGWRLTGGTALAIADIVLDWVIVGGESGPKARAFDLAWARSLVSQCRAAGVAVFVKQLGAKPYCIDGDLIGAKLGRKGGIMDEWPADLRVREWPQ